MSVALGGASSPDGRVVGAEEKSGAGGGCSRVAEECRQGQASRERSEFNHKQEYLLKHVQLVPVLAKLGHSVIS